MDSVPETAKTCSDCDAYVKVNFDLAARLSMSERAHQAWLNSSPGTLAARNMELRIELKELHREIDILKGLA